MYDTSSPAYRKAEKQFKKATRNANLTAVNSEWTAFRAAEKRYKRRFPPPDLSGVLDLALLNETRVDEIKSSLWAGSLSALDFKEIQTRLGTAYTISNVPGLVIFPALLSQNKQKDLVRWALSRQAKHPNETNLDAHYHLPSEGLWNASLTEQEHYESCLVLPKARSQLYTTNDTNGPRQLINNIPASLDNFETLVSSPKPPPTPSPTTQPTTARDLLPDLRWANIGWYYHWGSKQYDFSRGKGAVDSEIQDLCRSAVDAVDWKGIYGGTNDNWDEWKYWGETYEPDAGIVNFYQTKDTLMGHVDRSEVCATSPLVSVSLGNAAVFLIGGKTRDIEPAAILLRSGDVVIMSGPDCRRAYHGVPRILEQTIPPHLSSGKESDDWDRYKLYLQTTRININVRQVFPKGFQPPFVETPLITNTSMRSTV